MLLLLPVPIVAIALHGCAPFNGIKEGRDYPSETFTVPVSYQEAYRRADRQLRKCVKMADEFVSGNLYTDTRVGVLYTHIPLTNYPLERIDLEAVGSAETRVTITVDGMWPHNEKEITRARSGIQSGNPVCMN